MTTQNKTISLRFSNNDLYNLDFLIKKQKNKNKSKLIKSLLEEKVKKIQEEELKNAYLEVSKDNKNFSEESVLLFNEINNDN